MKACTRGATRQHRWRLLRRLKKLGLASAVLLSDQARCWRALLCRQGGVLRPGRGLLGSHSLVARLGVLKGPTRLGRLLPAHNDPLRPAVGATLPHLRHAARRGQVVAEPHCLGGGRNDE